MKEDIDMKLKKIFGLAGVIAASTVLLAACGGNSKSASDDSTLKVGIMTLDDSTEPVWDEITELAERKVLKSNWLSLQITTNQTKPFKMGKLMSTPSNTNIS